MTKEVAEIRELIGLTNNRDISLAKPIKDLFDECLNLISISDFLTE